MPNNGVAVCEKLIAFIVKYLKEEQENKWLLLPFPAVKVENIITRKKENNET